MSSDRIARGFKDILGAADLIAEWVDRAGGAEAAIFRDEQVRSAIERQVLIMSEAATRHRLARYAGYRQLHQASL